MGAAKLYKIYYDLNMIILTDLINWHIWCDIRNISKYQMINPDKWLLNNLEIKLKN
jgi:hypothetical protein